MSSKLFVGVDIGTQGVKAAVYDAEGRCRGEAFRKSDLHRPAPGVVEEDPEQQLRSTCEVIAECAAKASGAGSVCALSIDGQMAGIIGVGEDGRNVTPYDSWLDTRCAPWIERMQKDAGRRIVRKAGGPPSFNHGPKILWWKNERPETYRKIRSFVHPAATPSCVCAAWTARARSSTGATCISPASPTAGRERGTRRSAGDFGVDPAVLPRIVASREVVGELTAEMAARCGVPAGTPVVAGCGDTAASFLSCGATRPGICVDVAGTASVFAATTADFRADEEDMILSCGRSAIPGLWHPYAYINGGGMNLEWFREQLAGAFAAAGQAADFPRLNEMAEAVTPAEDDPFFIPHLGGRVSPSQPHLRGAWVGLTWSHGPGHLYRAVLEGVALEYGIYLRTLEKLFGAGTVAEVRVTGGGEKSAVWNRIKADTLGVPIVQVMGAGGAPLGSALLAGSGVGVLEDIEAAAAKWIRTGAVTEPDPRRAPMCRRRTERYMSLLASMNRWAEEEKGRTMKENTDTLNRLVMPFGVDFDLVHGIMKNPAGPHVRLASSMRGHYKDAKALEALVAQGDPVHYEVFEMKIPEETGQLQFCLSKTYPGTVGGECFMTKGHYHQVAGTAEIYLCLRGEGLHADEARHGGKRVERFLPGRMVLRPPALGPSHGEHRATSP